MSIRNSFGIALIVSTFISARANAQNVAPPPPASVKSLDAGTLAASVVPIRWKRFRKKPSDPLAVQCRAVMSNCARYNVYWIQRTFKEDSAHDAYLMPNLGEHGIRPACSVVFGIAAMLKTGAYDDKEIGVPREQAVALLRKLIRGIALSHQANGVAKGWGDQWQSAVWAALVGHGAWMLWEDLDADTRGMIARVVEHEANRFANPAYKVPYWRTPDDREVFKGDTKAEENAWNATVLQVAVAMMPNHPNAPAWKRIASELMVSAFSMKKDLANDAVMDGKPVSAWLHGYNVRDDGAVINHGILHPDYTSTPTLSLRVYATQALAGKPAPQSAGLNVEFIYRSLSTHAWPTPPYQAPGVPIYLPGKAEVYYPQGTDWSRFRFDVYYAFDACAKVFGWDKGLPDTASNWMRLRGARLLEMQARHADGHCWEPAEAKQPYPNDQFLCWQMGDAYLLMWLDANRSIKPTRNWLAE